MSDAVAWLCVLLGIGIICFGAFYFIAAQNPGGPPIPAIAERNPRLILYAAVALGVLIAVGGPTVVTLKRSLTAKRGR